MIPLVDELVKRKVRFTVIKEGLGSKWKQDLQTRSAVPPKQDRVRQSSGYLDSAIWKIRDDGFHTARESQSVDKLEFCKVRKGANGPSHDPMAAPSR